MSYSPDDEQNRNSLKRIMSVIERILMVVLCILALVIFAGTIIILLTMDSSSQSQGGRYYVAVGALVILGALDTQFHKLVKRRIPFSLTTTAEERRYQLVSLLVMLVAAVVLIGLAWILP